MSQDNLIRIMCPNLSCKRVLAAPAAARGKVVRCKDCGMTMRIPEQRAQAPRDPAPPANDPDPSADTPADAPDAAA